MFITLYLSRRVPRDLSYADQVSWSWCSYPPRHFHRYHYSPAPACGLCLTLSFPSHPSQGRMSDCFHCHDYLSSGKKKKEEHFRVQQCKEKCFRLSHCCRTGNVNACLFRLFHHIIYPGCQRFLRGRNRGKSRHSLSSLQRSSLGMKKPDFVIPARVLIYCSSIIIS